MPDRSLPARILVVAEVAQAHDGSLGMAHAYIDAAARAGADAVKFQTHIAAAESTPAEPWRVKFSRQDPTRFEYWKRMEFSLEHWVGLKQHADEVGLKFLSSPFSPEAVDLLERVGVHAWKVASGEVDNPRLFERLAASGRPLWISTGMSRWEEIDRAVALTRSRGLDFTLLQCTSRYPTPAHAVGLNVLDELRRRYACSVGLSDHSGTIFPGLSAATLGAELIEVHVTFSRESFGPDVPASLTTTELKQLVDGVRFIETMHANPVDKDAAATELADLRRLFGKGVVAARDLTAGHRLVETDLALKKPATGLPARRWSEALGRRLIRDLPRDTPVREDDLE